MIRKWREILFYSGVHNAQNVEQAEKMVLLNRCIFAAILLFIPNMIYEISLGLVWTVSFDLLFSIAITVSYLLNRKGYYTRARNLALISANLVLLAGAAVEGQRAGNSTIFLALIVVFALLVKMHEERYSVLLLSLFTVACIISSFAFCPIESQVQKISDSVYRTMFAGNTAIAFVLTAIFTYVLSTVSIKKEKQLIAAKNEAEQSSQAKSLFLSHMSHELRTPLNAIIGTSNLLLNEEFLEKQHEHLDILKYSSEHMLQLVNDVLDFSKIEVGKLELVALPVSLHALLHKIDLLFSKPFREKGLAFSIRQNNKTDLLLMADETRLLQILSNLLSNALKFTDKGSVELSLEIGPILNRSSIIRFEVQDTGIGILENRLPRIFESFIQADSETTRRYGGTGLGLSISQLLVKAMGAELQVASKPEQGTRFWFSVELPLSDGPHQQLQVNELSRQSSDPDALKKLSILVAEDNVINMRIARRFLDRWGLQTTEARNGREAVEACQRQHFDLLLLDLEMPEMDGYEALQAIRDMHPSIPAIAFSAALFPNQEEHLRKAGFNDFVMKPFRPEELKAKLGAYSVPGKSS